MKISRVGRSNKNFFLPQNFMTFSTMLYSIYREKRSNLLDHNVFSTNWGFSMLNVLKCRHVLLIYIWNKPNLKNTSYFIESRLKTLTHPPKFFGSRIFAIGRSSYTKHKYFLFRPYQKFLHRMDSQEVTSAKIHDNRRTLFRRITDATSFAPIRCRNFC